MQPTNLVRIPDDEAAMVLTQQEWADLAGVCHHYLSQTAWADKPGAPAPAELVARRRRLCERIMDVA